MTGASAPGSRRLFGAAVVVGENMDAWPRSAYVAILGLLVISGAAAYWLHIETRAAYRAVGFNDGQIQQRAQTMAEIQKVSPVVNCKQLQTTKPPIELLAVKAESLYAVTADDGSVRFCR
jgi:hypothetical protein